MERGHVKGLHTCTHFRIFLIWDQSDGACIAKLKVFRILEVHVFFAMLDINMCLPMIRRECDPQCVASKFPYYTPIRDSRPLLSSSSRMNKNEEKEEGLGGREKNFAGAVWRFNSRLSNMVCMVLERIEAKGNNVALLFYIPQNEKNAFQLIVLEWSARILCYEK